MKFIPVICASIGDLSTITPGSYINYYIGDGVNNKPFDSSEISRALNIIKKNNLHVSMIHLFCPNDVTTTYASNSPYFSFIRQIGCVGLTIHYKTPKCQEESNRLFEEILHMHLELPEAIWYIENEHHDIYGLLQMAQQLRNLSIEAYILIDTCHIQSDFYQISYGNKRQTPNMIDYIELFSAYIGAFHISASRGSDGFIFETHGKPIKTPEDERYFRETVRGLCSLKYNNDIIMIPEVTEEYYDSLTGRVNGKRAIEILKECLPIQKVTTSNFAPVKKVG